MKGDENHEKYKIVYLWCCHHLSSQQVGCFRPHWQGSGVLHLPWALPSQGWHLLSNFRLGLDRNVGGRTEKANPLVPYAAHTGCICSRLCPLRWRGRVGEHPILEGWGLPRLQVPAWLVNKKNNSHSEG